MSFSKHVRALREARKVTDRSFSLRKVAERIGIEPAYLSKIERGQFPPPGEQVTVRLAREIGEDPDVLLALAGKVSSDLLDTIRKRPRLFADVIRQMKEAPDHAILRVVREIKDGEW